MQSSYDRSVALFSLRRKQRWFAMWLSPVVLVASLLAPCATCCSFAKPAEQTGSCCHRVTTEPIVQVVPNGHACCQTRSAQAPVADEGEGCECCVASRPAWVASRISESELSASQDLVFQAAIDWSASAELATATGQSFEIVADESPRSSIPLRVLLCSWLI